MQGHAKRQKRLTRVFFEGFSERRGRNSALLFDLNVFGCVIEPPAQLGADYPDGNAEQEG